MVIIEAPETLSIAIIITIITTTFSKVSTKLILQLYSLILTRLCVGYNVARVEHRAANKISQSGRKPLLGASPGLIVNGATSTFIII